MTGQFELYLTKGCLFGEFFPAFFCVSKCLEQIYLKKDLFLLRTAVSKNPILIEKIKIKPKII